MYDGDKTVFGISKNDSSIIFCIYSLVKGNIYRMLIKFNLIFLYKLKHTSGVFTLSCCPLLFNKVADRHSLAKN